MSDKNVKKIDDPDFYKLMEATLDYYFFEHEAALIEWIHQAYPHGTGLYD